MRRIGSLLAIVAATGGGCQTLLNVGEADDGEPAGDGGSAGEGGRSRDDGGTAADGGATQDAADASCGETMSNANHCGRCGRKCNLGGACTNGKCARPVVFVTSTTKTGLLGGPTGADQTCNGLAKNAGLGGEFRAWLGPSSRFPPDAGAYYRLDDAGSRVSNQWPPGNTLEKPIEFDERGRRMTMNVGVWTDLDGEGATVPGLNHCQGWQQSFMQQGGYGDCTKDDFTWTRAAGDRPCTDELRLYCVELP